MTKKQSIVNLDLSLITKYFKHSEAELMDMSLYELIFLNNESLELKNDDVRSEKMREKVPYWLKFIAPELEKLKEFGFNEEEIKLEMTRFSDRHFFKEEYFKAGQKPYNSRVSIKLDKTGYQNFPVPRTRSGKTEKLPADYYHVSNIDKNLIEELIKPLMYKKYPFLEKLSYKIYGIDVFDIEHTEMYVDLPGEFSSLYVPILSIFTGDKELIIKRQRDYIESYYKRSADSLLNHPITVELFKELDKIKEKLGE